MGFLGPKFWIEVKPSVLFFEHRSLKEAGVDVRLAALLMMCVYTSSAYEKITPPLVWLQHKHSALLKEKPTLQGALLRLLVLQGLEHRFMALA